MLLACGDADAQHNLCVPYLLCGGVPRGMKVAVM